MDEQILENNLSENDLLIYSEAENINELKIVEKLKNSRLYQLYKLHLGTDSIAVPSQEDIEKVQSESLDKEDAKKLFMCFHHQFYDAVDWAVGPSQDVLNKYLNAREQLMQKEYILSEAIANSLERSIKLSIDTHSHTVESFDDPLLENISFGKYIQVDQPRLLDGIFIGNHHYDKFFENYSDNEISGQVTDNMTVEEVLSLISLCKELVVPIEDYMRHKFSDIFASSEQAQSQFTMALGESYILKNILIDYRKLPTEDEFNAMKEVGKIPEKWEIIKE